VTKTAADIEDLNDYEGDLPEAQDDDEAEDDKPAWSGRYSKIALAQGANLNRSFEYIGYRSECVDCKAAGKPGRKDHQFHAAAEKIDERWVAGPEAAHIQDLLDLGMLNNTKQAKERLAREQKMADVRGVEKSIECPTCREPIGRDARGQLLGLCPNNHRNGFEELKPRTLAQMKKLWANALPFSKAQEIERAQRRPQDEDERRQATENQLREAAQAMKEGGEAMKEAAQTIKESKK